MSQLDNPYKLLNDIWLIYIFWECKTTNKPYQLLNDNTYKEAIIPLFLLILLKLLVFPNTRQKLLTVAYNNY